MNTTNLPSPQPMSRNSVSCALTPASSSCTNISSTQKNGVECRVRLGANITLAIQGDNALLHSRYHVVNGTTQRYSLAFNNKRMCLLSSRRPDPSACSINKQDQQTTRSSTTLQPCTSSQTTVDATAPGEIRPCARAIARFDPVLLTRAGKLASGECT
jgi:hypothetical protein